MKYRSHANSYMATVSNCLVYMSKVLRKIYKNENYSLNTKKCLIEFIELLLLVVVVVVVVVVVGGY
jgi:hypothetical protein